MIVFVYLEEQGNQKKFKIKRARRISYVSTLIIVLNALTYGFCDSYSLYFNPKITYIHNLVFTGLAFLLIAVQIPFKFYLTKEFLFILYDELKNRGISSKIEDLRAYSSNGENQHYSQLQIEKLREDLYQIVRMPFLKFSNKEYFVLTSIAYMCTVGAMVLVNAFLPPVHLKSLIAIHWEVLTATCAFVEPIIIFILPGLCYYKMSIKDQLE